jgi:hypothetical protein
MQFYTFVSVPVEAPILGLLGVPVTDGAEPQGVIRQSITGVGIPGQGLEFDFAPINCIHKRETCIRVIHNTSFYIGFYGMFICFH